MTELSRDARAVIAQSRGSDNPTPEDRARLRAKLAPSWAAFAAEGAAAGSRGVREGFARNKSSAKLALAATSALLITAGFWAATRAKPEADSTGSKPAKVSALAASPVAQSASNAVPLMAARPTTPRLLPKAPPQSVAPRSMGRGRERPRPRVSEVATAPSELRTFTAPKANLAAEPAPETTTSVSRSLGAKRGASPQPSAAHTSASVLRADAPALVPSDLGAPEPVTTAAAVPVHDAPSFVPQPIDDELALLGAAQDALKNHQPTQALRLVQNHAFRFPRGALAPERIAVQTLALCELNRPSEARQMLSELAARAPDSALLARVRRNCGL